MTADLARLADCLRTEFGVEANNLMEFAPDAHNTHVLASVVDDTYHLTVRDLTSTEDTPPIIEQILAWCAELGGSTGRIVRTHKRSREGTYLVAVDGLHLSVRLHLGNACDRSTPLATIVECATEHGLAIDAIASQIQIRRHGLRYRPMSESLRLVESRLMSFVAQHATEGELAPLLSATRAIASESSHISPRLVHGDLSFMNLILVDGAISVIDHDCLHPDHPLYDHAHLLVSLASSKYFHGDFSVEAAERYLACWSSADHFRREDLLLACEYVVLKKLALVQQPKNLHLNDRLSALRALRALRAGI